jgi:hypothetical protein
MPQAKPTVAEVLRAAHEAVKHANIPQALQPVAFEKAVDLLVARADILPAAGLPQRPGAATPSGVEPTRETGGTAEDKTLAKIAATLGLSPETVGDVYHVNGDMLALGVETSKLSPHNRVASKEIALLIAAGRQAGGWDPEWTAASVIRPVAEVYGKHDGNFSTALKEMDDEFIFSGSGAGRKVRLKRKGSENAVTLIKRLAGEE